MPSSLARPPSLVPLPPVGPMNMIYFSFSSPCVSSEQFWHSYYTDKFTQNRSLPILLCKIALIKKAYVLKCCHAPGRLASD